jgi:hypothetical protein
VNFAEPFTGARSGNAAKIFISYSRKDLRFAQMLAGALGERGFEILLDRTDIAPGELWRERLTNLIAAADAVVFVISPDSVASTVCAWELAESDRLGKRLAPLVARRVADADAPPALARINWVFCAEDDDKDAALAALDAALRTDLAWVREHTRLAELARRWDEQGRRNSAALRGGDIEAAERWLDRQPASGVAPTELHQAFIRASRRAATARQRFWVAGSALVAVIALALAGWAEINRREAQKQRVAAEAATIEAVKQRDHAEQSLSSVIQFSNGVVFDLLPELMKSQDFSTAAVKTVLDNLDEFAAQSEKYSDSAPAVRAARAAGLLHSVTAHFGLNDAQGALDAAMKARDMLRQLLVAEPEEVAHRINLALSEQSIGSALGLLQRPSEAMPAYQESLRLFVDLAAAHADRYEVLINRAATELSLGQLQAQQNLNDLALIEAAASHFAEVAGKFADRIEPGLGLAAARQELGERRTAQGRSDEARGEFAAGVDILTKLQAREPRDTRVKTALATIDYSLGALEDKQGRLDEAANAYQQGRVAIRDLVATQPLYNDLLWRFDDAMGELRLKQGNQPWALSNFKAAAQIARSAPDNQSDNWRHALAKSDNSAAIVLTLQEKGADAAPLFDAALEAWRGITEPSLSALTKIQFIQGEGTLRQQGDAAFQGENFAKAAVYYSAADNVLSAVLRTRSPADGQPHGVAESTIQAERAYLLDHAGAAFARQSLLDRALSSYQDSVAIQQGLSDANPAGTGRRRDLASSLLAIGGVFTARNNLGEAVKSYRAAFAIIDALAKAEPASDQWRADLRAMAPSFGAIGYRLVLAGEAADALTAVDQAIALAPDEIWLYGNRATALMFAGRADEARALFLKYKDEKNVVGAADWRRSVLADFAELRKAGRVAPLMDEIEKDFANPD